MSSSIGMMAAAKKHRIGNRCNIRPIENPKKTHLNFALEVFHPTNCNCLSYKSHPLLDLCKVHSIVIQERQPERVANLL